jgi:hypothetical protein
MVVLLSVAASALLACGGCNPGEMRCHSDVVQICSANDAWTDLRDCTSDHEACVMGAQCSGVSTAACCK